MKGVASLVICLIIFIIIFKIVDCAVKNKEYTESAVKAALYVVIAIVTALLTWGKNIEESYLNFLIVAVSCIEARSNYRMAENTKKQQEKDNK